MATVYRDYGAVYGYDLPNNEINTTSRRQVYQATHGGDDSRLPFMKRSFISFSFGTRPDMNGVERPVHIEDFDLIATINSNSLNRTGYASFEDTTTKYDNLDGQYYWSTHYKSNSISFTLSTDGIDQPTLDDFLSWFRAGVTRELILSEHPNRAILARVSDPPQLNLLPFEHPVQVMISGQAYTTSTTLYKGDISLNLVMDEPYWYAKDNILGIKDGTRYLDKWIDVNGEEVYITGSKDALKILYEDGIPLGSMIQNNMLLGNGAYASVEGQIISRIWSIANDEDITWSGGSQGSGDPDGEGARIEDKAATAPYLYGVIAGAMVDATGNGITKLASVNATGDASPQFGYFFYSGNAPAPTIISFSLSVVLDSNTNYAIYPRNKNTANGSIPYNTLTIESVNKQELRFTTPNILTSYNKAIEIFTTKVTTSTTNSWEDIRTMIREEVRHAAAREWAIRVIDQKKDTSIKSSGMSAILTSAMSTFLKNSSGNCPLWKFTFNSETGEAIAEIYYRTVNNPNTLISSPAIEDVGDMLLSNYIIIRDRNYPTANGAIVQWEAGAKTQSHRIYHDYASGLELIQIIYKNMYL